MSDEITEGFAEFAYKDNDDCAKIWKDVINLDSTDSKFEKKDSPILVNKKGVADMQRKGDSTVYVILMRDKICQINVQFLFYMV